MELFYFSSLVLVCCGGSEGHHSLPRNFWYNVGFDLLGLNGSVDQFQKLLIHQH